MQLDFNEYDLGEGPLRETGMLQNCPHAESCQGRAWGPTQLCDECGSHT